MRKDQFNFKGVPRGPKKFSYTYIDIGKLCKLKPSTIREYASKGKLDPNSLKSVVNFIIGRRDE